MPFQRSFIFLIIIASMCFLVTSCAWFRDEDPNVSGNLMLPMPEMPVDPSDEYLKVVIRDFLEESGAPLSSGFDFKRVDLNDDNLRDALVMMERPYGYWCGLNGCTMLVMKAGSNSFSIVSSAQPVRAPVYVSDTKTQGWRDIIVHVSGRNEPRKDVALQFDGQKYPASPPQLPAYLRYSDSGGEQLFWR